MEGSSAVVRLACVGVRVGKVPAPDEYVYITNSHNLHLISGLNYAYIFPSRR